MPDEAFGPARVKTRFPQMAFRPREAVTGIQGRNEQRSPRISSPERAQGVDNADGFRYHIRS